MQNVSYLVSKTTRLSPQLESVAWEDVLGDGAWIELPLLGTISAGLPIDLIRTEETVKVPAAVQKAVVRKESYALRVKGNSMIDENIQDGDIIIVKSQTHADNGQSVVAMINGEQTTLKKFYVERDGIRLQPANPTMAPILLTHEQVQILGIVQCILRVPG